MVLPSYQKDCESEEQLLVSDEQQANVPTSVGFSNYGVAAMVVVVTLIVAVFAVVNKVIPFPSSAIMQSSAMVEMDTYKSPSRTAPIFMSSYVAEKGLIETFFEKYAFLGKTSFTGPGGAEVKGDAAYWVMSTVYIGETCSGDVVSTAGFAGATCFPYAISANDDPYQSIMLTCGAGSTSVTATLYENTDCTGASASYPTNTLDTCETSTYHSYFGVPYEDTEVPVSMIYTCGTPDFTGYDVQQYYISPDTTTCNQGSTSSFDGAIMEGHPTGTCVPMLVYYNDIPHGQSSSIIYDKDASLSPFLTLHKLSRTCEAEEPVVMALDTECEDETTSMNLGTTVFAKWYYKSENGNPIMGDCECGHCRAICNCVC